MCLNRNAFKCLIWHNSLFIFSGHSKIRLIVRMIRSKHKSFRTYNYRQKKAFISVGVMGMFTVFSCLTHSFTLLNCCSAMGIKSQRSLYIFISVRSITIWKSFLNDCMCYITEWRSQACTSNIYPGCTYSCWSSCWQVRSDNRHDRLQTKDNGAAALSPYLDLQVCMPIYNLQHVTCLTCQSFSAHTHTLLSYWYCNLFF